MVGYNMLYFDFMTAFDNEIIFYIYLRLYDRYISTCGLRYGDIEVCLDIEFGKVSLPPSNGSTPNGKSLSMNFTTRKYS